MHYLLNSITKKKTEFGYIEGDVRKFLMLWSPNKGPLDIKICSWPLSHRLYINCHHA